MLEPGQLPNLLEQIAAADYAFAARVADVTDDLDGALAVTDGRASGLADWNHAALFRPEPGAGEKVLSRIARFFTKRGRVPALVLDPGAQTPENLDVLTASGWSRRSESPVDLMLWNPEAAHLFTDPSVYMTLATNATVERWIEISVSELAESLQEQAAVMLRQVYRSAGAWFYFGLYNGEPAGACPIVIHEGFGRIGPAVVVPEFRRKGVGLALINYCTRQSRKDGAATTYLYSEHGGPAAGLCQTSGYTVLREDARPLWTLS